MITDANNERLSLADVYRFMGHRDGCRLQSSCSFLRSAACTCGFDTLWIALAGPLARLLDSDHPARFMGLEVVSLEPADVCVLRAPQPLNDEQRLAIRSAWERFAPGIRLVILDSGLSLDVLRRVEAESHGEASFVTRGDAS